MLKCAEVREREWIVLSRRGHIMRRHFEASYINRTSVVRTVIRVRSSVTSPAVGCHLDSHKMLMLTEVVVYVMEGRENCF